MRRSSLLLLAGAMGLGLLAAFVVNKSMQAPHPQQMAQSAPKTYVVVAAEGLKFGDKITTLKLRRIEWPGTSPSESYQRVADAVGDGSRTVLRNIAEGEVILSSALTGEAGRLASSSMLGEDMRAMSIAITEISSSGGFIAPGDRVDVLMTRVFADDISYVGAIVQGARVLAVGQNQDTSTSEPDVLESATLEVTPQEAQKLALGQEVGKLTLVLRPTGNESRAPLPVASATELFGMQPPRRADASAGANPVDPNAPAPRVVRSGPEVRIVRGTETTSYQVPQ